MMIVVIIIFIIIIIIIIIIMFLFLLLLCIGIIVTICILMMIKAAEDRSVRLPWKFFLYDALHMQQPGGWRLSKARLKI